MANVLTLQISTQFGQGSDFRMQIRPRPEDIARLKAPLGQLLTGEPDEAIPKLLLLIEREKPPKVVTVGDVVSRETWKAGLRADCRIVDGRVMRKPVDPVEFSLENTYRVRNPAGGITMEGWNTIRRAMRDREAVILVDGEEDLLTLPAIVESPDEAMVVYGQPFQGLVVVTATRATKSRMRAWLDEMEKKTLRLPKPKASVQRPDNDRPLNGNGVVAAKNCTCPQVKPEFQQAFETDNH